MLHQQQCALQMQSSAKIIGIDHAILLKNTFTSVVASVDNSAMSNIFLACSMFPCIASVRAYIPQSKKSCKQNNYSNKFHAIIYYWDHMILSQPKHLGSIYLLRHSML
jgi:hypothetical protein